jgi:hypothetical protein
MHAGRTRPARHLPRVSARLRHPICSPRTCQLTLQQVVARHTSQTIKRGRGARTGIGVAGCHALLVMLRIAGVVLSAHVSGRTAWSAIGTTRGRTLAGWPRRLALWLVLLDTKSRTE